MKDYLLGSQDEVPTSRSGATPTSAQSRQNSSFDAAPAHRDERHDSYGHSSADESADHWASEPTSWSGTSDRDEYEPTDDAYERGYDAPADERYPAHERDGYETPDPRGGYAQPTDRGYTSPAPRHGSGYTPQKHHAWDDDDSMGDTTGGRPDATAAFQQPAQPPRPRKMSPRERPWLKIDGQRYPLLSAITILGRDDDADIVIDDSGVSRHHSEIRVTHDGPHLVMSIRDLDSTNGTYVNGDRIDSEHLHDGDRLTVGRTNMTIHLGDRP